MRVERVQARAAQEQQEERKVRKLAGSHHAPADWKYHAQMVVLSWVGKTPNEIAAELDCHPQTVRIHVKRFNAEGIAGLGMRPGSGRKTRLTEQERSRILALAKQEPPGHLWARADGTMVAPDEAGSAQWTLNALAQAAKEAGMAVKRSQIRRMYLREGVRWRHTHSWGTSDDPDFVRNPNRGRLLLHRTARGVDDHLHRRTWASSAPHLPSRVRLVCYWAPHQGAEKTWVYGALRVRDGKELTRCAASRTSTNYIALLADIEADNLAGDIFMIDFQPFQPQQCSDSCLDG